MKKIIGKVRHKQQKLTDLAMLDFYGFPSGEGVNVWLPNLLDPNIVKAVSILTQPFLYQKYLGIILTPG
jgi:hypothetical protein